MFDALKKYGVFHGRARRKEYWLYALLYFILAVAAAVLDKVSGTFSYETGMGVFSSLLTLALFLPSLAVSIRRLHDIDKSGWWMLMALVPILGIITLWVFFCLDGTVGSNRFGEDPKASERATA